MWEVLSRVLQRPLAAVLLAIFAGLLAESVFLRLLYACWDALYTFVVENARFFKRLGIWLLWFAVGAIFGLYVLLEPIARNQALLDAAIDTKDAIVGGIGTGLYGLGTAAYRWWSPANNITPGQSAVELPGSIKKKT